MRQFKFTVEGQYKAAVTGGGDCLKNYKLTFILPSVDSALSQIVIHLLKPKLRKEYPDFIRVRTHKITKCEVVGQAPDKKVLSRPIETMSMEQLSDFCLLSNIYIDPFKLKELSLARETVAQAFRDKTSAQEIETVEAQKIKAGDELRELNELPKEDQPVEVAYDQAASEIQ